MAEFEQNARREDVVNGYIAMANTGIVNSKECFLHDLFGLCKVMDGPVPYSISEGWAGNNLGLDDSVHLVDVVEFGNATSEKVDFIEVAVGVDFRIERFGRTMLCEGILCRSIPSQLPSRYICNLPSWLRNHALLVFHDKRTRICLIQG